MTHFRAFTSAGLTDAAEESSFATGTVGGVSLTPMQVIAWLGAVPVHAATGYNKGRLPVPVLGTIRMGAIRRSAAE